MQCDLWPWPFVASSPEIPCHNAQRKFAMDAWKGWNQRSWNHPIHGHCMSNPQARKTSQNILSFQRTWKRHGRRLNFVIFLTTCILPCETVHDIFTNIQRWACPARGSLYHIDSSLTAQCRLQSTGRGASCWQLHLSLPHPPTSCSMRLVLARHFSDFVWITSLWCPSVTLMVYSPHKVSICPRMLGIDNFTEYKMTN